MTRYLALAVCLLFFGCAPAARAPSGSVAETAEGPATKVFMWRTESATSVVHLLGSIHVGTPEMYPLDDRIERAFAAADALVLEIDLDEEAEAEAALAFVQMALLPRDQVVDDLLDDETRTLLHARLDALEIPYDNVKMFRPWFIAMTIEMKAMEDYGFSGDYGIDQHFRDQAVGQKRILELESVEEQASLFASLTANAQLDELRMALEPDSGAAEMLAQMAAEWRVGRTELITAEVEQTRVEYPEAYEALYANRNRKMTEKVGEYLRTDDDYFVVAGSAHMVGEEGIVELLRQHGHEVVQQ